MTSNKLNSSSPHWKPTLSRGRSCSSAYRMWWLGQGQSLKLKGKMKSKVKLMSQKSLIQKKKMLLRLLKERTKNNLFVLQTRTMPSGNLLCSSRSRNQSRLCVWQQEVLRIAWKHTLYVQASFMAQERTCWRTISCRLDFRNQKSCPTMAMARIGFRWYTLLIYWLTFRRLSKRDQRFLMFWP